MATAPITAGPSKFDLSVSLFTQKGKSVKFTVDGKSVEVCLSTVQAEDGSGESWNLTGYIVGMMPPKHYKAYFSTQSRKGHFEVID